MKREPNMSARDMSVAKDALWFLNFKNHVNYTISTPQCFSNSILVQEFIFFYFLVPGWESRERACHISTVKRKQVLLTPI
jgi:hypothetical protein